MFGIQRFNIHPLKLWFGWFDPRPKSGRMNTKGFHITAL